MKIVQVITRLILGGAQENTLLTCEELARRGHDVTLVTGPPSPYGSGGICPEGSLLEEAEASPYRTVVVDALRRPVCPVRDLVAYGALASLIRQIAPDVVHTHSSKAGILGRRAAWSAGVPCVVHTIHGLAFDAYRGRLANWLFRGAERRAARWSDRLIAVCERMADRAAEAGLAPRRAIAVIYSGMDTQRFLAAGRERDAARADWDAGPQTFVFVKLARLFPLKGHRFVLPAFAEVARHHPNALLVLLGAGVLRRRLEAEARRLGIADCVRFEGLVPRQKVPGAIWAADAVVHAGLREGLARVLVQAALCERPVVTYDIGGARELVTDGVNGYLVAPPAPGAKSGAGARPLAQAMRGLAADAEASRQMGKRWPPAVRQRFDYREMVRQIERLYEEALRV